MINEIYLQKEVMKQMKHSFKQNDVLLLNDFFSEDDYEEFLRKIGKLKFKSVKIPDKFSYEHSGTIDLSEIKEFISELVGKVEQFDISVKRFGHRDYTLLHDENEDKLSGNVRDGKLSERVGDSNVRDSKIPRDSSELSERVRNKSDLEFFIFICDEWDESCGGMKVYADSSGKEDAKIFVPQRNTFCIVKKGTMHDFVKYVNNKAGKKSFILIEGR